MPPKTNIDILSKKLDDHIEITRTEFGTISGQIAKLDQKFSKIYVKNGNGLIAGYDRADYEMMVFNELKQRPTLEDVKKLLATEMGLMENSVDKNIKTAPRKFLSNVSGVVKDWSIILSFLFMITTIVMLLWEKL